MAILGSVWDKDVAPNHCSISVPKLCLNFGCPISLMPSYFSAFADNCTNNTNGKNSHLPLADISSLPASYIFKQCIKLKKIAKNWWIEAKNTRKTKVDSSLTYTQIKETPWEQDWDWPRQTITRSEWKEDANINWSQLARRYGLTKANGIQGMKYLAECGSHHNWQAFILPTLLGAVFV